MINVYLAFKIVRSNIVSARLMSERMRISQMTTICGTTVHDNRAVFVELALISDSGSQLAHFADNTDRHVWVNQSI
jgi:hypothetical protein